jgi:hypothetical protein
VKKLKEGFSGLNYFEFPWGCIPRRLRRVRHSGGSRNPEDRTGFRIKCGMTEFKVFDTPLLAAG